MPKVSVLMGIYNEKNKQVVESAISSILNQTFSDFEFIICDDGSDEEFYLWLKKYCKRDSRIRFIRNKTNKGLAYSLNRCLKLAAGDYVARMDADDFSFPQRFEKQVSFLDLHQEIAVVGCNVQLIDSTGVWGMRKLEEFPTKWSLQKTLPFIHPSILIRARVLKEIGGYRDKPWTLRVEDYDMFLRLYAAGYQGYNLQEVLFQYREDAHSFQKKKYRYRINEFVVRYLGFRQLGIFRHGARYVLKPLVVGIIPCGILRAYRGKKYGI